MQVISEYEINLVYGGNCNCVCRNTNGASLVVGPVFDVSACNSICLHQPGTGWSFGDCQDEAPPPVLPPPNSPWPDIVKEIGTTLLGCSVQ